MAGPWTHLSPTMQLGAVSSDGAIVYAYDGTDLHLSIDTGSNFAVVLSASDNITCVACDYSGVYCVVGVTDNIYVTSNSGAAWTTYPVTGAWEMCSLMYNGTLSIVVAEAASPTQIIAYYVTSPSIGFDSFSISSVSTWGGVPAAINNISMNTKTSGFNIVYASVSENKLYYGLYSSITSPPTAFTGYGPGLQFSRTAQNSIGSIIYATALNSSIPIVSVDSGTSWSDVGLSAGTYSAVATNVDAGSGLASGEGVAITANGGQIYISTDLASSFTARESNNDWNAISMSNNGQVLYASVPSGGDAPGLYQSTDGGLSCFMTGTMIRMADGNERPIDMLCVGETVATTEGPRVIRNIGHFHGQPAHFWRLPKNAVSSNVPHTDLWLTGGHSILFPSGSPIPTPQTRPKWAQESAYFYLNSEFISVPGYINILARDCPLCDQHWQNDAALNSKVNYYHIILEPTARDGDTEEKRSYKYFAIWANGMTCETMSIQYRTETELIF